jgi:diguanylate cyclase (GGDEF)-like protein/PAS domain S-box-containing protein
MPQFYSWGFIFNKLIFREGFKMLRNDKKINILLLSIILIFSINLQVFSQEIIINELMASNKSAHQDNDGDFNDWLELKNNGNELVNLSGYYLSDDKENPTKWQFNPDIDFIIRPGEYLLLWADDETDEGELHTNFKLSRNGETISLTSPDGNKIIDEINYPEILTDFSYGRDLNDISKWKYFSYSTPLAANNSFGVTSYFLAKNIKFIKTHLVTNILVLIFVILISFLLINYFKLNQKLKITKNKYKDLFEENPAGLIIADIDGNIHDLNKQMVELLGAPNKEAVKRINLTNHKKLNKIWNKESILKNDTRLSGEINFTTSWNKEVYLRYRISPEFLKRKEPEIIIVAGDISKEKETEKKLKFLSFKDELTELYNRRYFENEMDRLNQSRNLPISIIIGDLDNLKYVNDNYGHKAGDEYIRKAVKILNDNFRDEDIISRIGGDEFGIILPNTDNKTALNIIKRIKESFKKCNVYNMCNISLGCATKNSYSEDIREVFKKADKEMYEDKKCI